MERILPTGATDYSPLVTMKRKNSFNLRNLQQIGKNRKTPVTQLRTVHRFFQVTSIKVRPDENSSQNWPILSSYIFVPVGSQGKPDAKE